MPADDIIIIGPHKVQSNLSNQDTADRLRQVADALEAGEVQAEAPEAE